MAFQSPLDGLKNAIIDSGLMFEDGGSYQSGI